MKEPMHLTDAMFDEVIDKAKPVQIEILFIRIYGILQALEKDGENKAAEHVSEAVLFMLERIREQEAQKCEK